MTDSAYDPSIEPTAAPVSSRWMILFVVVWQIAVMVALFGGPALGDHEVIVAQIARQTLESGEWIVLRYLDTPFLVKPPLAPWMVAVFSRLLPGVAGPAVTDFSARLPSAFATFLTVLLVWRLGRSMYGPRGGAIAGIVYATSLGCLLFGCNATAEAWLALFCTWGMAEFWWAQRAAGRRRFLGLVRFYLAFGLAMLAKGPMPLIVLSLPLAVWWLAHRPLQLQIAGGAGATGRALRKGVGDFPPRIRDVFSRLGIWWGLILSCVVFVPWMLLVARRAPYVWELWEYEYLGRLGGAYPGDKSMNAFYYLPILAGLLLPWSLSVPEALAAPFLRRHQSYRLPLIFAWCWAVVSVLALSLMSFKKPYYLLPAVPAVALLLAPVLDRLFFAAASPSPRSMKWGMVFGWTLSVCGAVGAWLFARHEFPQEWNGLAAWVSPLILLAGFAAFTWAAILFAQNRRWPSLGLIGGAFVLLFVSAWRVLGPSLGNVDAPMSLVAQLERSRVPPEAPLYWASNRPDGRVTYYGRRKLRQIVDPYMLIAEHGSRVGNLKELREMAAQELIAMMGRPDPIWCLLQRKDFRLLTRHMGLSEQAARELFSVDRGKVGVDGEDWVVVTNAAAGRT